MVQATRVLQAFGISFEEHPFGGAAIDGWRKPLPPTTLEACRAAEAVLVGAVGGPHWEGGQERPEPGLIQLRKGLDVYANLRPAVGNRVALLIGREPGRRRYYWRAGQQPAGPVFHPPLHTPP